MYLFKYAAKIQKNVVLYYADNKKQLSLHKLFMRIAVWHDKGMCLISHFLD